MIISKSYKYVFTSTPKTGTHSFYRLLQDEFDGKRLGPHYHRTEQPSLGRIAPEYTYFSTVRNPYERMVAMWNSLFFSKPDKHNYREAWMQILKTDDFTAFCKFAAENKDGIERIAKLRLPMLMIPQHRWYTKMPEETIPLHLENISVEFHELPFVDKQVNIPRLLHRKHAPWSELKTEENTAYINEWAGNDFEKFGYDKEDI